MTLREAAIRYRAAASEISCRLADEWQGEDLDETCLEDLRVFSEADAALAKALAQEPEIIAAADRLASAKGHDSKCAFTGCSCGAVEAQKAALSDYWKVRKVNQ